MGIRAVVFLTNHPPRKLAVISWNMVVKGVPYLNPEGYLFLDQKRKLGLAKRIKKQIDKFGLAGDDLGLKKAEFKGF